MRVDIQEGEVWPYGLNWGYSGCKKIYPDKLVNGRRYISLKINAPFMKWKMMRSWGRDVECLHVAVLYIAWRMGRLWWHILWEEITHSVFSDGFEVTKEAMEADLYRDED